MVTSSRCDGMCKKAEPHKNELLNLSQELQDADLNAKTALNADLSEHNLAGEGLRHFLEADAVAVAIKREIRRLNSKVPAAKEAGQPSQHDKR